MPDELHAPIQVYESLCRRGRIGERELAAVKNLAVEEGERTSFGQVAGISGPMLKKPVESRDVRG